MQGSLDDLEDSFNYTGREGFKLGETKDFWSIIQPGFITRPDTQDIDDDMQIPCPARSQHVSASSWPVLKWFISLMEKDQALNSGNS